MRSMRSFKTFISSVPVLVILLSIVPSIASATTQNFNVTAQNVQQGMLMSLSDNAGIAEPASDQNSSSLLGVAGQDDQGGFDLKQPGQMSIITNGAASTVVSTLNGDVRVGDRITSSSIVGVGARAKSSGWIVGIAQGSLDAKTAGAVKSEVFDSKGGKHSVYIARIPVLVKATYFNEPVKQAQQNSPDGLQAAADKVAGKHAKMFAIILSSVLMFIGLFLAAQLVNSSVRNGFAAISRQPLTKRIIIRKIIQTFGIAASIIVLVFLCSFMILRLL